MHKKGKRGGFSERTNTDLYFQHNLENIELMLFPFPSLVACFNMLMLGPDLYLRICNDLGLCDSMQIWKKHGITENITNICKKYRPNSMCLPAPLNCTSYCVDWDNITKLPESGDLCDNITEFGVVEGSPEPPQTK